MDRLIIGYGYLARGLGLRWASPGNRVFATTRKAERFAELREEDVEPVLWDVRTSTDKLPAVDTVLYCVGFDRSAGASMREVYVDGLRRTLDHLPLPKRLIYVSSTGVYGDTGGEWVDESTPPNPSDPSAEVCLEAEGVIAEYAKSASTQATILRFAGIYGYCRLPNVNDLVDGKPIAADPNAYLNLIDGSDGNGVVAMVDEHPNPASLYLVADGNPVLRRDFYAYMAELLGVPAPKFDPSNATSGRRVRGNRRICIDRLRSDFGYKNQLPFATPNYRVGLEEALKWHMECQKRTDNLGRLLVEWRLHLGDEGAKK